MRNQLTGNLSTTTEQLLTPPSSLPPQVLGRVSILSTTLYVECTYRQKSLTLFEREYSWAFSREQRNNTARRSGRGSLRSEQESKRDSIVKRELHPTIPLFLTLYLTVGSEVLPLVLSYVIVSLLFGLEKLLGYLHVTVRITLVTSRLVLTLHRVPRFQAPIHVPARPCSPSPHPPPPYVRGPRVILEEETDESLTDSS
jgi:hypothetical protein